MAKVHPDKNFNLGMLYLKTHILLNFSGCSRFKTEFKPTKFLGNGTYGSVFAAEKVKDTTMKCAVKRIPLEGR